MDESVFHVFVDFIQEWFSNATSLFPEDLLSHLYDSFKAFGSTLKLTSGFSMERMWRACHPLVPSNLEAWTYYDQLIKLVERFDVISSIWSGMLHYQSPCVKESNLLPVCLT